MTLRRVISIAGLVCVLGVGATLLALSASEREHGSKARSGAAPSNISPVPRAPEPVLEHRARTTEPRSAVLAESSRFPRTPAGAALEEHCKTAEELGNIDEMTAKHEASLARLRPHAREAVTMLYDAVHGAAADPQEQWTLVKVLGDLRSPLALEALDDIARSPLPAHAADESEHSHDSPEHLMHTGVRTQAVDGLAKLAADGSYEALQSLYELAVSPAFDQEQSLKMTAILGYVGRGNEARERAERLNGRIPASLAWTIAEDMLDGSAAAAPEPEAASALGMGG
jgi:hypothetical protein